MFTLHRARGFSATEADGARLALGFSLLFASLVPEREHDVRTEVSPREKHLIPPPMIQALHDAVAAAVASRDNKHYQLKDAVCGIVDTLRTAGEPPERVLTTIRALIHDAPESRRYVAIADYVLPWCLDQYFPRKPGP